jgi:hypothetical protein
MQSVCGRLALVVPLTLLADLWLFRRPAGVGLTLLALAVAALGVARYGRRLRHAHPWTALWLALALAATLEPSATGIGLLIVLGWALVAMSRLGAGRSLFEAVVRGLTGGLRSFTAAPRDARRAALISSRRGGGRNLSPAWVYVVPAGVTCVFAALVVPANLMLFRWATEFTDTLRRALSTFDAARLAFWALVLAGLYGLFRFRLGRHPAHARRRAPRPQAPARAANELRACLLTLLALNILFLAANATDLAYLWMRFELPGGVTYAQYAHQGTTRLIVAVVLAAVTIVVFFRRGTAQTEHRTARALAGAFVVQNVFVLAGAASRLVLYAGAYGLTRLRVATFFWLALVAVGFVLLGLRILQRRTLRFLLDANTASTLVVLALWAMLDVDGYVADWNVDRHLRDPQATMDVSYLGDLGPGALPALARLARDGDPEVAAHARRVLDRRVQEEREHHAFWASWSYRRHAALRAASPD